MSTLIDVRGAGVWTSRWSADWDDQPDVPSDVSRTVEQLIREGAQVISRADVFKFGEFQDTYRVIGGSVDADMSAGVVRSCGVTLEGTIPQQPTDLLAPSGAVVRPYRGVRDWTGEEFWVAQGTFGFEETEGVRSDPSSIDVSGFDFGRYVSDARWEEPYEIARGTPVVDAISDALQTRLPESLWQPLNASSGAGTTPAIVWGEERDNDPWDDLTKLAESSGMWLYFDRMGVPTLEPVPDPDDVDVSWVYTAGDQRDGLAYLDGAKTWVGRPYNMFVIRGEAGDDDEPPILATVSDEDPASPSYVGNYRRPYFLTSGYVTSVAQALSAGRAELNRRKGLTEQVHIESVPIPMLDVGQAVQATDPVLGVDARYIIDTLSMPLRLGRMELTTRRRRL